MSSDREEVARLREALQRSADMIVAARNDTRAIRVERDAAEQRANRLAMDINTRDAILDRAGAKLGWPSGLSVASYWRDRMEAAVDETAGRISKLENLVAQARESYPRAAHGRRASHVRPAMAPRSAVGARGGAADDGV